MVYPWLDAPSDYELHHLQDTYHYCPKDIHCTVLSLFFQWGTERDIVVLVRSGRFSLDASVSVSSKRSPLSIAVENRHYNLVQMFLDDPDYEPDLPDEQGLTPLCRAARSGYSNVASCLLSSTGRINVNTVCSKWRTPLSYAAVIGAVDIIELLLGQPEVNINLSDSEGRTPFFYAAMHGREGVIEVFLNTAGLEFTSPDSKGFTALTFAILHEKEGVVIHLLRTQAFDINVRDNVYGQTPLVLALNPRDPTNGSIAKLLLKYPGVDVTIPNHRGQSPLDVARRRKGLGVKSIIKKLMP
jgi:ankyrin repeat protein